MKNLNKAGVWPAINERELLNANSPTHNRIHAYVRKLEKEIAIKKAECSELKHLLGVNENE